MGTVATLTELLFSDHVAKFVGVIAFTYKLTLTYNHMAFSIWIAHSSVWQKPQNCFSCNMAIMAMHPGHRVNSARKQEGQRRREVDKSSWEKKACC